MSDSTKKTPAVQFGGGVKKQSRRGENLSSCFRKRGGKLDLDSRTKKKGKGSFLHQTTKKMERGLK